MNFRQGQITPHHRLHGRFSYFPPQRKGQVGQIGLAIDPMFYYAVLDSENYLRKINYMLRKGGFRACARLVEMHHSGPGVNKKLQESHMCSACGKVLN